MIRHFNKDRARDTAGEPDWPDNPRVAPAVFAARPPLRKLKVLVDATLVDMPPSGVGLSKSILLHALLSSDVIEWYRYPDGPLPADIEPLDFPRRPPPHPIYAGWAVAYPWGGSQDHRIVMYTKNPERGYTSAAVRGNLVELARTDHTQPVYQELDAAQRAERRAADMVALQVANQALHADVFITERPYLLSGSGLVAGRGVTVCTREEAIPLLALYLRAQREYIVPTGAEPEITTRFSRGLYFWVGARELLPEAWRWLSACAQYANGSGNGKLMTLGGSLLNRVSRALQERDAVHVALNKPTDPDTVDEALEALDTVLVLLMGAVDISARVAHSLLSLSGRERNAGWQNDAWLKQVAAKAPSLAAMVAPGTHGEQALTILRLLRNSVHGAALQGVRYLTKGKAETRVGLPSDDETAILAAMDAMGGRASWGVQSLGAELTHVEPATLVERLFEAIMTLLNDLMRETPVESLPHVTITSADTVPPAGNSSQGGDDTFSEWNRLAIRWQLGL